MIKRCLTSLVATLIVCFLACSSASARVCFLPDSTDCGEGNVVGGDNVEVPCQYSSCPAYNSNYQECYDERTYNNAGVNVTCKQIRCKLSKSECEEQEDDSNSSQCCNFDSASGCYYMGKCPILCNRNIYDRTTDLSGEDYTCTSCKDKNGIFYNCTAIEKECYQINSNYTSSCSDSQIAKEVEGIKDSHGNQCYTCEDKPIDTPVYPTCAEKGYQTCAKCSTSQICELNGEQGSDGPCAKGCRDQDVAICSSVTSVSTKYNYLKKMIDGLAINQDAFSHLGIQEDFDLYETMRKAGLVQPDWEHHKGKRNQTYISDEDGNLISVFMRNALIDGKEIPRVHMDIYLDKTMNTLEVHQVMPIGKCMDVYKNLMKPIYCQVDHVGVYSTNYSVDKMTASYGEGFCGGDKICLQNISDNTISSACNSCQEDNRQCYMPIIFRQKDKPSAPVNPTCAEKGYKTCSECSADQICDLNGEQGSDGPCSTGCHQPTCAEKGYQTCAKCSTSQICELNGEQGSDGPCAKGCRDQDVAICSSVTSVSTKYNYLKKMIDGLAINQDAFSHLGIQEDFDLYETMRKAGLVQPDWEHHKGKRNQTYISDEDGNLISVFMRNALIDGKEIPRVHMDIYLDKTMNTLEVHQVMPIGKCMDVYKNLMKPIYCQVDHVGVYSTNYSVDKMTASYGEGFCGKDKTCLQDISDDTILSACNSCQSDNVQCYMPIIFRQKNK